ncbi:hypothetical protein AB0M48_18040 [Lentzea sp. NPDC051208]|uniref:hypothetical protein n=1 Tax=Lentzea sp. NPDC051208 TaxID=3154642 RepID=UPI00341CADA5
MQDHRPEFGALFGLARLPIGYFTLEPVGAITGVDLRLDLWNAELTGTITTAAGVCGCGRSSTPGAGRVHRQPARAADQRRRGATRGAATERRWRARDGVA